MKDSKKYASEIQKLYRAMKKKQSKPKPVTYDDVVRSVVYGSFIEYLPESTVRSAFRRFNDHFVDFNDLRVSRVEEIVEMIGTDSSEAGQSAGQTIKILRAVFKKYNVVNLDSLHKIGKRQARVVLEKFDGISQFVIDYAMLTSLGAHAIPLTTVMISYLKENGLVHADSDYAEIEGFLTRQISAANAFEFYEMLRHESEAKAKQKTRKKTTKKKSAKKKVVKKKKVAKKATKKKTVKKKTKKKTVKKKTKK